MAVFTRCANPTAQCAAYPGVTTLNEAFGCQTLNGPGADGECMPLSCPSTKCNGCPAPCAPGDSAIACATHLVNSEREHSCSTFYAAQARRILDTTVLPGCGSQPCVYTYDATSLASPFTFEKANSDAAVSQYQKFLNATLNCMNVSCKCLRDSDGVTCGGNGTCAPEAVEGGSTLYTCVCSTGWTGAACTVPSTSQLCALGMDPATGELEACSGGVHGSCDTKTLKCVCQPGWGGAACDVETCLRSGGLPCSGHGTCSMDTALCSCLPGYTGPACNCGPDGKKCAALDTSDVKPQTSTSTTSSSSSTKSGNSEATATANNKVDKFNQLRTIVFAIGGVVFLVIASIIYIYVVWKRKPAVKHILRLSLPSTSHDTASIQ